MASIEIVRSAPRWIAAVRRSVRLGEVGAAWRPALDLVWTFLRAHPGLRDGGHNVFVYHHPSVRGAPMEVDFGVEVTRHSSPKATCAASRRRAAR